MASTRRAPLIPEDVLSRLELMVGPGVGRSARTVEDLIGVLRTVVLRMEARDREFWETITDYVGGVDGEGHGPWPEMITRLRDYLEQGVEDDDLEQTVVMVANVERLVTEVQRLRIFANRRRHAQNAPLPLALPPAAPQSEGPRRDQYQVLMESDPDFENK